MKRKLLRRICLLIFMLMTMVVSVSATPTAYAVYSDGTFTFKYGEMPTGQAYCFDVSDTGNKKAQWSELAGSIKKAVFDSSFASARPKSCFDWFHDCANLKEITGIENLNTSDVTNMQYMFSGCKSLTSLDVSGFNTSNVTNMLSMFYDCSSLTSLDLSSFNTSNVPDMSYMFRYCSGLTSLDLSGFDTHNVTNMLSMFQGCSALTSLDVSGFNTSNVTNMLSMFSGCKSLTSLDLKSFDTSSVTCMGNMFSVCESLTSLDLSGFNTSNVTDMCEMFRSCSGLANLDVSSFNTSKVWHMEYMFCDCSSLTSLDLGGFDTSNVMDMSYMFSGCSGLTSLDISGFNTSRVTGMIAMFQKCSSLTSLDISGFNTSRVTGMSTMFQNCSGLTSLNVSGFNTSNVENMDFMFSGCSGLTSLDLSCFNTLNVTNMEHMFYGCSSLTSLDVSSFNTSKVTNMKYMFSGCSAITSLDLGGFDTSNVMYMIYMFEKCSKLTTIYSDETWNCSSSYRMFYDCLALKGAISYNSSKTDATYANPETGYFTYTKYLTYDLTISGKDVTGENCKDLSTASDLIKGTVSYDPSTKTLYMKNATIEYSGNAISSKIPGLTIKAEGKNVISATKYSALSLGAGTTTITGDSLELHGGTSAIGFIYGTDSHLIIDGMAELTAEGATHGIRGNLNGSSTTELEVKNGATVRAKGATQSISDIDKLTLGAGISLTTPAGAQYKDNGIADASGTAIAGEWVEIGPQKYALWICGKQFTSANSSGITVPNSQGTASYDAETSTLTLNGFGVYTQDSEPMLRSSIDGLVIKVIGTSTLLAVLGTTIEYSGKDLTITGDSLNLISNKEGIYMSNSLLSNNLNIQNMKNLYVVSFGAAVKGNVRVLRLSTGRTMTSNLTTLNVSGPTSTLEFSSSSPSLCDLNNLNLNDGLSVIIPLEAQFSSHKLCASDGTEATYAYIGKLGDANNDGSVTMADANMVVNYFLSTDKSDIKNFNRKKANVNGDNDITMADANAIVNMFLAQ